MYGYDFDGDNLPGYELTLSYIMLKKWSSVL